ncbi:hypothetical protein K2Y11_06635 [bacterium]|nr:hypothetical protein [bacterium]
MRLIPPSSQASSFMRIALVATTFFIQQSWGDGGVVLASTEVAGTKYLLVGKPDAVSVGPIDLDLVLEGAVTLPESIPVTFEHVDGSIPKVTLNCVRAKMFNVPLYRIHANLSKEGTWKISLPASDGSTVNWRLTIAPPKPVGWSILAWILWPIPIVLIFIWREKLIRRRKHSPPGVGNVH